MFIIAGFTFAVALFGNCKGSRYIALPGEAVERVSTFWKNNNNIDTPYITLSEKAWYQDSIGITQICRIWSVETDTSRSINIITIGYRFVDLKKKRAYEYASFSDTASVKRKYRYTDTTLFPGGWNFATRKPISVDSFHFLPDTIINAIAFKRCQVNFESDQYRFEGIGLFRCDKKNTHFKIDTAISNKIGCPLVSFRYYPINNPHAILDQQVKFISNHLPDSVLKVFAAWKRNENLYPVQ
jgi:hypothetical protein